MSNTELRSAIAQGIYWAMSQNSNPDYQGVIKEATDKIENAIHARERALLAAIREELPEVQGPNSLMQRPYRDGREDYKNDVAAILTKYEEMK